VTNPNRALCANCGRAWTEHVEVSGVVAFQIDTGRTLRGVYLCPTTIWRERPLHGREPAPPEPPPRGTRGYVDIDDGD
jgi:hypothetical protein